MRDICYTYWVIRDGWLDVVVEVSCRESGVRWRYLIHEYTGIWVDYSLSIEVSEGEVRSRTAEWPVEWERVETAIVRLDEASGTATITWESVAIIAEGGAVILSVDAIPTYIRTSSTTERVVGSALALLLWDIAEEVLGGVAHLAQDEIGPGLSLETSWFRWTHITIIDIECVRWTLTFHGCAVPHHYSTASDTSSLRGTYLTVRNDIWT